MSQLFIWVSEMSRRYSHDNILLLILIQAFLATGLGGDTLFKLHLVISYPHYKTLSHP